MACSSITYDMVPFDGKSDFNIWKLKLKSVLILQNVFRAVTHAYLDSENEKERREMNALAYSAIILNLPDAMIRKVGIMKSAKDLWDKLDELYVKTFLPSKMFLMEKLFRFKLDLHKSIDENVDVLTKLVQDIKFTGDKHIDDYALFVLLNAIPDSYSDDVKSAIKYENDSITLENVVNALKSKELDLKYLPGRNKGSREVMDVRGRSKSRHEHAKNYENQNYEPWGKNKNHDESRSKSRSKGRRCFNCGEVGHFIKQCPKPNKNK